MIREIHVAPEFCLVLVLPLSDLETLGTSLIFFGQAKILSSFKILCFSICFISKPARHETNLYSSAIAQLSRQLLHMAIPLLILNLQVPTDCGLVFLINHTHFWITCYKPIFIFFFSVVFLPQGNLCWFQASVDVLPEDQQAKNSFAFPTFPHHQQIILICS